jgi:hypothetical protein
MVAVSDGVKEGVTEGVVVSLGKEVIVLAGGAVADGDGVLLGSADGDAVIVGRLAGSTGTQAGRKKMPRRIVMRICLLAGNLRIANILLSPLLVFFQELFNIGNLASSEAQYLETAIDEQIQALLGHFGDLNFIEDLQNISTQATGTPCPSRVRREMLQAGDEKVEEIKTGCFHHQIIFKTAATGYGHELQDFRLLILQPIRRRY